MKYIRRTTQFKKDFKRIKKSGKNILKLQEVVDKLFHDKILESKYRDHVLTGNYHGYKECHIESDWLLIYQSSTTELVLVRTGSHAELF